MTQPNNEHRIDIEVGRRLKQLRKMKGYSQASLARAVGITFQQIQKYENAKNRLSVSRLTAIAHVLQVPFSTFVDPDACVPGVNIDGSAPLLKEWQNIHNPEDRKLVLNLAKTLAQQEQTRCKNTLDMFAAA
jgi:transcriptional regulator with XRE-family HTH domain